MTRKENGWIDPYPHYDFDGPCCVPEAYGEYPFSCDNNCGASLKKAGICVDCVDQQCQSFRSETV